MKIKLIIISILLTPVLSFAHGSKIGMVSDATSKVLSLIESKDGSQIKEAFYGVKSWTKEDSIFVKVYYKSVDGEKLNSYYNCAMDHSDGKDELVCDAVEVEDGKVKGSVK